VRPRCETENEIRRVHDRAIFYQPRDETFSYDPRMNDAEPQQRLAVIDFARGAVMVLMALDHVRTFFTNVRFPPEDMEHTWMALFMTRWVTHFCAPLFFLLAGTSAYLSGARRRSVSELASHLWRRGLWLVALELTFIGFAWSFTPGSSFAGVIWCLGWSMVVLSLLIRLPRVVVGAFAILCIAGHDLLDGVPPKTFGPMAWLWRILHAPGVAELPGGHHYFVLFPLIPWFAVMALGYAIGPWFQRPLAERTRIFVMAGTIATIGFIVLRLTNAYGNPATSFMPGGPGLFRSYPTTELTVIAFLNTEKYPPSLQFLLMTLGPSLLAIALMDSVLTRRPGSVALAQPIIIFGRVPFFYYVCHLYLIHAAALVAAIVTHQQWQWLAPGGSFPPDGYGWNLSVVWAVWLAVVVALYFPCRWFDALKRRSRASWLSYV
jgi:uncharacterized membrane protein